MKEAVVLKSALLERAGFAHAFSTRNGGVSEGGFASLNLARTVGDDPAAVEENYRRFAVALGVPLERLAETSQVHGAIVAEVDAATDLAALRSFEADAIMTTEVGLAVGVRVADCVPILVADPRTGAVAAVHAGWRGAVAGVLGRAIAKLEARGARRAELVAAVGPHIGPEAFEVGEDVAATIASAAGSEAVVVRGYDKPHISLEAVIRRELDREGVLAERVERVPGCTFTEGARFHSYRRDAGRSGRLLAAIVARVGSRDVAW